MVKVNDVVSYVNGLVGKGVDADGWYGTQCMDLTVDVMQRFFGWRPYGNAIALVDQPLPAGFQRIRTTSSTQIKAGDVMIWGLGYYAQYGHTAIATEDGRADGTFVSVDQNWNNPSLEVGSPAAPIHHNMDGVFGVIRPPYEAAQKPAPTPKPKPDKPNLPKPKGDDTMLAIYYKHLKNKNVEQWLLINGKRVYLPTQTWVNEANALIKAYGGTKEVVQYNYDNFGLKLLELSHPQFSV